MKRLYAFVMMIVFAHGTVLQRAYAKRRFAGWPAPYGMYFAIAVVHSGGGRCQRPSCVSRSIAPALSA